MPEPAPGPAAVRDAAAADAGPLRTLGSALALLRSRRFGIFWFACLLSNIGTWAQQVAQPWLLLSIGASPVLVGLDAFAMDAPGWLLTLFGGVLADRADRRRVIGLFQSVQMLCPLLLVILLLNGAVRPWIVIVTSLVVGVTDALSMPSFQSIVPSMVERDRVGTALALNSTQFNLSRILGPALAGVLMTAVGVVGCYAVNTASYLPFILVALWILPRAAARGPVVSTLDLRHPFSGARDILRTPSLRGSLLLMLVTSACCAPLVTFCPVLVRQVFNGNAAQFSMTVGAFGVGGLLGASGLLAVNARRDRRRISAAFAMLYGLTVIAAALSPRLWGLTLLLVGAGISMSVANIAANTFLMHQAAPSLRGQVVSLYMLALRGGGAVGSLLTGVVAGRYGAREALLVDGALALLLQFLIVRRWSKHVPPQLAGGPSSDGSGPRIAA